MGEKRFGTPPVDNAAQHDAETEAEKQTYERLKTSTLRYVRAANGQDMEMELDEMTTEQREKFLLSPEAKETALEGMKTGMDAAKWEAVKMIIDQIRISEEILLSAELQSCAQNAAKRMLRAGSLVSMKEIAKKFQLSETFLASAELKEAASAGVAHLSSILHADESKNGHRRQIIEDIKERFAL